MSTELDARRAAPHPRPAQRRRGVRDVPRHTRYVGQKRFGLEGAESAIADARRGPRRGRRRRARRRRAGHGAPRPAQRAGQHRGQVLRPDLQGVRGQPRPRLHPGLRRREVPPRPDRQVRRPPRRRAPRRAGGQPVAPRGGRPGRRGHGPGQAGPHRRARGRSRVLPVLVHGDAAFAGQGVVAETLNLSHHQGLPRRRHRSTSSSTTSSASPPPPRVGPLVGVPHRRRQDGPGADLPRERRRPRGVRARGPAGVRVPPGSSTRTSSSTWSATGATVTTRATTRATRSRSCTSASTPSARCASSTPRRSSSGATSRSRRPSRRSTTSRPASRRRSTRPARPRPPTSVVAEPPPPPVGVLPHVDTGVRPRVARRRSYGVMSHRARGLRRPPQAGHASSRPATRWSPTARSTGRSPRRWPSARCSSRARRPPRRPGHAARHVLAAPRRRSSTTRPAPSGCRSRTSAPTRRKFWIYDSLLSEYAAVGFEYGYSVVDKDALRAAGRRSSATSSTAPRSSSTSSSWPPRTSGARPPGSSCCCRTATRARAPSTPRRASSGSSRCAPRTTSRSPTPPTVGAVLPPAAPPDAPRRCASRWSSSRPSRCCGPSRPARRSATLADGLVPGGARRPARPRRRRRRPGDRAARRAVLGQGRARGAGPRDERGAAVAVVRVEQLYPWPEDADPARRSPATRTPSEVVWLQEEPENMGPWNFVHGRLHRVLARRLPPAPRQPRRVGQPGHRQPRHPRAGAAADPRRSPRLRPARSDRPDSTSGAELARTAISVPRTSVGGRQAGGRCASRGGSRPPLRARRGRRRGRRP